MGETGSDWFRTGRNRLQPVIITEYGKDFRKYGYNSKRSKLDASF